MNPAEELQQMADAAAQEEPHQHWCAGCEKHWQHEAADCGLPFHLLCSECDAKLLHEQHQTTQALAREAMVKCSVFGCRKEANYSVRGRSFCFEHGTAAIKSA